LGKLISPALAPASYSNPGYTTFTFDVQQEQLTNLEMHFLQLEQTYGLGYSADVSNLFISVNYGDRFGLTELNSNAISTLNARLMTDLPLAKEFIHLKRGFPEYTDTCLFADTTYQGFASPTLTKANVFTSLDTGLLTYFCFQT
jgi:hypothetical protein